MMKRLLSTAALAASLGAPAVADQVFTEDVIIDENLLCVGPGCVNGEADIPGWSGIKLKSTNPAILFEDNSTTNYPDRDWRLSANEPASGGREGFFITDVTAGTSPFWIEGGAPENALYIRNASGDVGLGTMFPLKNLHILDTFLPTIRIEETGNTPYTWDLTGYSDGFFLSDKVAGTNPMYIRPGAPSASVVLDADGNLGLGTNTPEGKLHVKSDGVQINFFESGDGNPVQVRFRTDSENRRFLAVNNANEVKSQIIFKDNEILFTGQTDSGANRWLTIGPSGILSQGPSCSGAPCDRTFDTDFFTVPPIAERAAYMWENRHLPAVGPTTPGEQINLTEKTGGIIHELEVAHIYIEQLNAELAAERERITRLESRLDTLLSRN